MKTTPVYQLPYPESGDHTRTWEYWQALAEKVEAALSGKLAEAITIDTNAPLPLTNNWANIQFNTITYNTLGATVAAGVITIPTPGLYLISVFARGSHPTAGNLIYLSSTQPGMYGSLPAPVSDRAVLLSYTMSADLAAGAQVAIASQSAPSPGGSIGQATLTVARLGALPAGTETIKTPADPPNPGY